VVTSALLLCLSQLGVADTRRASSTLAVARNAAHLTYVAPFLQGRLDLAAGFVAMAKSEHRVAASYFREAFEGLAPLKTNRLGRDTNEMAEVALGMQLVSLALLEKADEATRALSGKMATTLAKDRANAAEALCQASSRSDVVPSIERVLTHARADYAKGIFIPVLVIENALNELRSKLVYSEIRRVCMSYSDVDIPRLSTLLGPEVGGSATIGPTSDSVSHSVGRLICDGELDAQIDEVSGTVSMGRPPTQSEVRAGKLVNVLDQTSSVLDALRDKAARLTAVKTQA
ncbi:hypothetical protein KIPB_007590, partial [Kipferlia bialata]